MSRQDTRPRLLYMPALDGVRGLAVLAVLAYHANLPGSDGGFLGVEVFFVLSGYLITALLLAEIRQTGTLQLGRFWQRRVRRLAPALLLLLVLTPPPTRWFTPDALPRLRADLLPALTYTLNWAYLARQVPYFEHYARPPLWQHLWSLAIEEQFYVVWPLLLLAWARLTRGTPRAERVLLLGLAVGSAASVLLRWWLYRPYGPAERVYYGTDTRAAGLFLGAAWAVLWPPNRLAALRSGRALRFLADGAGWVGILALLGLLSRLNDYTPRLYRGGFLLTDAATLLVLLAAAHPRTTSGRGLAWGPLRWIGQRSYGLYLWHWPVVIWLRPTPQGPLAPWRLALAISLSFGLAALSYRWLETPIRRQGWRAWWRRQAPARRVVWVLLGGLLLLYDARLLWPTPFPRSIPAAPQPTRLPVQTRAHPTPASPRATPTPRLRPAVVAPRQPTSRPTATSAAGPSYTFIGDSVMQAAVTFDFWAPWEDQVAVDVHEGRTWRDVPDLVETLAEQGRLAPVVVLHLGTNGPFPPEDFDAAMQALLAHGVRQIYIVNIRRPVRWEDFVNEALAAAVARWPQARLLDWHSLALQHPEWFVEDQTHLRYYGAQAYVHFLMEQITAPPGTATPTPGGPSSHPR